MGMGNACGLCATGCSAEGGGMLFGHWFPPHALCSVLPFLGRRVGVATPPHTKVLFEQYRMISIRYHFLHVTQSSLFNIKIPNILLELKCFNLVMVVSGGLGGTTSNQVGCWQPELGRNYCLQLIQG